MNYPSAGYTDQDILDKLEKYAGLTGRSRSEVLDQALALFMDVLREERLRTLPPPPSMRCPAGVDEDDWLLAEIQKGIDAADRGELIPHEEVMRQAWDIVVKGASR